MGNPIQYFFTPRGVALIGASSSPDKLSYGVMENMTKYGFQGAVYPVNPKGGEILGHTCYTDISNVPDPVDLAVVMIPAPYVPATLEACGKRGVKAVIIISGGFKEVGKDGAALEAKCLDIAHHYGMRIIGPNCVGAMDLYSGLNTTFIRGVPETGHIGFISQSGAVCGAVIDLVKDKGVGFSHFVSMGNEMDVDETDLIDFLKDDPNVRVIAAYVEAIRNGPRFIETAKRVSREKPIVLLKAGRSEAGEKAVSSHTGSLAGTYTAYQSAFKQAGVIEANSAQELFDIAAAFASQPLPKGKHAVIVTNAGGPAALVSDSISKYGFKLVDLQEQTKNFLRERLNPSAQVENPVDMLGGATPQEYGMALEKVMEDEFVDVVLPVNVPTSLVDPVQIAEAFADAAAKTNKTVISCVMGEASIHEARRILQKKGVPIYTFPEQVGVVLNSMENYSNWLTVSSAEEEETKIQVDAELAQKTVESNKAEKHWGEAVVRPLLEAYQIPVVQGKSASNSEEAVSAAETLGFPVAMKVISPDILHKSDAGALRLNLKSSEEVQKAYETVLENSLKYKPDAKIEGVLIEMMAPKGIEIIVGMRRDAQFGPLMMFGLGGIYVELFTDIAFRIAPFSRRTAREMIRETKAGTLLAGLRGQKPTDEDAVVDVILRLAQLSMDYPQIEEIEINPLMVLEKGKGAVALDARAILKS